jgi:hypothetical protein
MQMCRSNNESTYMAIHAKSRSVVDAYKLSAIDNF